MPELRTLAAGTYAALAAADLAFCASASPEVRRFRLVTKPLLMPALGTAFASSLSTRGIDGGGVLRKGTVVAQALSGVGDISLLDESTRGFMAGLSAFFGAHVAYTAAFASVGRPLSDREGWGPTAAAAGLFAVAAPLMGKAAGAKNPALRAPVIAYAGMLSSMLAASTRIDPSVPAGARRTLVAGTALFFVSDTILATREFLLPDPSPAMDAAVMATYTVGQALIAAGVAQAVRSREG